MKRLMNISHPMSQVLERLRLGHVVVGGSQDLKVGRTLWYAVTAAGHDRLQRPRHVDKVLLGPLPGVIGPCAGIREGVEGSIRGDQPDDLSSGLVGEFLEGDLADDLVAEVAPGPKWGR